MPTSDVFAMKNSDLNPFLQAEVGTELNGSRLTILSMLARLGADPWAEAARWSKLPKATSIDGLAQNIGQMPLPTQSLIDAHATAARLILLLPSQNELFQRRTAVTTVVSSVPGRSMPTWLPMALFYCLFAAGLAATIVMAPKPVATIATPSEQNMTTMP